MTGSVVGLPSGPFAETVWVWMATPWYLATYASSCLENDGERPAEKESHTAYWMLLLRSCRSALSTAT